MSWTYRLSKESHRQFQQLPRDRQQQLARSVEEMTEDPFRGDLRPIESGKFKGALRKRVGRYRIIFVLDPTRHLIKVAAILVRTEKTYR